MNQSVFKDRRERLLKAVGSGVALFAAPRAALRNGDVEHVFRQGSDLHYLSGFDEPESVLLLSTMHPEHRAVLFVRPRNPEREAWDGRRAGVEGAVSDYGVDAAFPIGELAERLPGYLENAPHLHYRLGRDRSFDDRVLAALDVVRTRARREGVSVPSAIVDPAITLHELRLRKSREEVQLMEKAIEITRLAHRRAMEVAKPGVLEYQVEAEIEHVFRMHGSERPAYPSIVGSGPNAVILHYRENSRKMEEGDLLLVDAGCELDYYASDITRTFPVGGTFTAPQRAIYDVVLAAQLAAIDRVRPGNTLEAAHDAAVAVLVDGMIDLGLLAGSRAELIENGAFKQFYLHRTSHWLGMDVHDVGAYFQEGQARPMEPGFVLTVEPGLYVAPDAEVDARLRGIGVRIEDDVLVTESGHDVLSKSIPKDPGELERILADRA